jgi:hypothetical protein
MADLDRHRILAVYLQDHRAGAVAGRRVSARLAKRHPEFPELADLAGQIAQDAKTLDRVLRLLRVRGGLFKRLIALVAQLTSQLTATKPHLNLLLELEMLASGVTAKSRLWIALESFRRDLPGIDLDSLHRRARSQLEVLGRLHEAAVRHTFGSGS